MKAALDRKSLANLPKARRWLDHVEAAFAYRQPLNPADGESAELASLIRGNVVAQLMNLHAQPPVARAVAEGRLTVHGWYYDILTGRIEEYDEKLKKFVAAGGVEGDEPCMPRDSAGTTKHPLQFVRAPTAIRVSVSTVMSSSWPKLMAASAACSAVGRAGEQRLQPAEAVEIAVLAARFKKPIGVKRELVAFAQLESRSLQTRPWAKRPAEACPGRSSSSSFT